MVEVLKKEGQDGCPSRASVPCEPCKCFSWAVQVSLVSRASVSHEPYWCLSHEPVCDCHVLLYGCKVPHYSRNYTVFTELSFMPSPTFFVCWYIGGCGERWRFTAVSQMGRGEGQFCSMFHCILLIIRRLRWNFTLQLPQSLCRGESKVTCGSCVTAMGRRCYISESLCYVNESRCYINESGGGRRRTCQNL